MDVLAVAVEACALHADAFGRLPGRHLEVWWGVDPASSELVVEVPVVLRRHIGTQPSADDEIIDLRALEAQAVVGTARPVNHALRQGSGAERTSG